MTVVRLRDSTDLLKDEARVSGQRLFDVIVACTGIVLVSPIMFIVALAIWIDDGPPIFFSQTRLGQSGRHFRIYKFRKFHKEAGTTGRALTVTGDVRMTRLGRFLERAKIDELPQLWNILKGDMSVVGPRPESLVFADCFTGAFGKILDHKPGIFGPNQAAFRDEGQFYPTGQDPEQFYRDVLFRVKAEEDLAYFRKRTLGADVGWIIRGVLSVLGLGAPHMLNKAHRGGPRMSAL
jgi:lipopolysaccharide/colanic/teichoic acid biosynthesis glycosyltransferase